MTVTVAHVPEAMAIEYHLLELSVGPALPPAPDVTAWRAAVDELRARYGLRPIDPVTGKLDW